MPVMQENRMRMSDLSLDKYCVTQSGCFVLATTVALDMGIIDEGIIFCHGISEGNVDKKISTGEYNNRKVYDCFNEPFMDDFFSLALNLLPITIDDRPHRHNRAQYTPYLLPPAISVASENFVNTFTIPSDSPQTLLLTSYDHNLPHEMNIYKLYPGRLKRIY